MSQEFNYPSIAANARLFVATRGRFIRILELTGPDFVTIEFPNQDGLKSPFSIPVYAGTWIKLPDDQYFDQFFIVVGATPATNLKLTVVDGIYGDDRVSGSISSDVTATVLPTGGTLSEIADGAGPVAVGAGLCVSVAAANANRKNLIVRNTGASPVYLRSDNTAQTSAFEIGAGQSAYIEMVAEAFIFNSSGASVNIQVSEVV